MEAFPRKIHIFMLIFSFLLLRNVVAFEFGTKFRFQLVMNKKQQDYRESAPSHSRNAPLHWRGYAILISPQQNSCPSLLRDKHRK